MLLGHGCHCRQRLLHEQRGLWSRFVYPGRMWHRAYVALRRPCFLVASDRLYAPPVARISVFHVGMSAFCLPFTRSDCIKLPGMDLLPRPPSPCASCFLAFFVQFVYYSFVTALFRTSVFSVLRAYGHLAAQCQESGDYRRVMSQIMHDYLFRCPTLRAAQLLQVRLVSRVSWRVGSGGSGKSSCFF